MIRKLGVEAARSSDHTIIPGKKHRVTVEKRGRHLSFQIDDLPLIEGIEFDDSLPAGYFGFYIWAPSEISRVRIYELLPEDD